MYRARQLAFDRIVAIKFMHGTLIDEESRERFKREGMALSVLSHKNIPKFYHFGLWRDQVPYIAMEFLSGNTLRKEIFRCKQIPWREAVSITRQICDAMHHAHCLGIIHRDLKPENLVLEGFPAEEDSSSEAQTKLEVKVCDFGLARICGMDQLETLTETGFLIGSARYMSPEQCAGKKVDLRADIYSLGCILFELISGECPFQAENPIAVIHKHVSDPVPRLPLRLGVPGGLDCIIHKAMAKKPTDRYQSMDEFQKDLQVLESGAGDDLRRKYAGLHGPKLRKSIILGVFLGLFLLPTALLIFVQQRKQVVKDASKELEQTKQSSVTRLGGLTQEERESRFLDLFFKGEFSAARAIQEEQLAFYRRNEWKRDELKSLTWLARCDSHSGKVKEAIVQLHDILQRCESGDYEILAGAMESLGEIHYWLWCRSGDARELAEAAESYSAEQSARRKDDQPFLQAEAALKLAKCKMFLGEHANARAILSAMFTDKFGVNESDDSNWGDSQRYALGKPGITMPVLTRDEKLKKQRLMAECHCLAASCFVLEEKPVQAVQEFRLFDQYEKTQVDISKDQSKTEIILAKLIPTANPQYRLKLFNKALSHCLKDVDANNADVLTLYSIPVCQGLIEIGDLESAKVLLQGCLKILSSHRTHFSSEELAVVYRYMGFFAIVCKFPGAEEILKKGERFCLGSDKSSRLNRVKILHTEGLLYHSQHRFQDCARVLNKAVGLYNESAFDFPVLLFQIYTCQQSALGWLAVVAMDRHEYAIAADHLKKVEDCCDQAEKLDWAKVDRASIDSFIRNEIELLKNVNMRMKNQGLLHHTFERLSRLQKSGVMHNDQCLDFVRSLQNLADEFRKTNDHVYAGEITNYSVRFLKKQR